MITEGVVAFCNLSETERYNGQDTGKYSVVVTMEPDESERLAAEGVKVKEYKDQPQRKFASKYPVDVVDVDGNPTSKHIPYGSLVRLQWKPGQDHPTYGVAPYLSKVKVLEMSENGTDDEEDF